MLCAVHLLIWDRRERPAPPVRVEYSLVLAMATLAHALDGLVARDTTGHCRGGRVLLGAQVLVMDTQRNCSRSTTPPPTKENCLKRDGEKEKKGQKRPGTKSELQHRTWLPRNPQAVVPCAVTWYFLHFSVLTPSSDMATPEGATRHG